MTRKHLFSQQAPTQPTKPRTKKKAPRMMKARVALCRESPRLKLDSVAPEPGEVNTVQLRAKQYNTVQLRAKQYNTVQLRAKQYNTVQLRAKQYNTVQLRAKQYNTVQLRAK